MDRMRLIAWVLCAGLALAGLSNYIPGLTDAEGRTLGIFRLNLFQDILHFSSAAWAGISAATSRRASVIFHKVFGALYLADGVMGVAFGSGYLDLGIVLNGILNQPLWFNFLASIPHLVLGGVATYAGFVLSKRM
jgi:hypothetical protein